MKTLAEELRDENDRLSFKIRCAAIKGKKFTLDEVQELCEQREQEISALNRAEQKGGE